MIGGSLQLFFHYVNFKLAENIFNMCNGIFFAVRNMKKVLIWKGINRIRLDQNPPSSSSRTISLTFLSSRIWSK